MSAIEPKVLRQLKAKMALKDLSLIKVSELSGVPYASCSQILNGRLNHTEYFARIRRAIRQAPMPMEAAVA